MSEQALFLFIIAAGAVAVLGLVGMIVAGVGLVIARRGDPLDDKVPQETAEPPPFRRVVPAAKPAPLNSGPPPRPPGINLPSVANLPADLDDDEPTELMTADKLEKLLAQLDKKGGPGRVVAKDS